MTQLRCWVLLSACIDLLQPIQIGVFFCCVFTLATLHCTSDDASITCVRVMTDRDDRSRIDALAKHLSDLRTGLQPAAAHQAQLMSVVVTMRSELAVPASTLSTINL